MTTLIMGDVEGSGDCPGMGDMAMFALIVIEPGLSRRFESGLMRPECARFRQSCYDTFGITREQHETAPHSISERMHAMSDWLASLAPAGERFVLISDNPGYDAMWIGYECHHKLGHNPFGHSARRIGDVYAGLRGRPRDTSGWKKFRKAPHDHNPLNDAFGNAEAWLTMWEKYGPDREARLAGIPKPVWRSIDPEGLLRLG